MPFKLPSRPGSLFAILLLFAGTAAQGQQYVAGIYGADRFDKGPAPDWIVPLAIPAAKTSPEPTTIRLSDTQLRWDQQGQTGYYHRVVQANNTSGIAQLGQLQLEFNPAFQTMTLHTLKILRQDKVIDKLAGVRIRFLERELGLEQSIYNGAVTVALLVDDVRIGDTLDLAYSIHGSNPVFKGVISDVNSWQNTAPVQWRRISIQTPPDRPVTWRFIGPPLAAAVKPQENRRQGFREVILQQRDLPPFRDEGYYPRGYQPATWLLISEYRNWNQVARWAADLFNTAEPAGADYKALVTRLRAIDDPAKQAVAALDFVQSEIRYTSVSFGENSHRPAAPDDVLARRYGDCKDKTLLLVSLYRALGLEARPVLLGVAAYRGLDDWLPGTAAFDHAIVKLELRGKTYWLDPTAAQKPRNLDTLGRLHDGTEVLVVDGDTQRLQTIERGPVLPYIVRERVRLERFEGAAILEKTATVSGAMAENLRNTLAQTSQDQLRKDHLNEVQYSYTEPERIGELTVKDDVDANTISLSGTYRIKNYAEKLSDGWVMGHRPAYIASFFSVPEAPHRNAPYSIGYPIRAAYSHEVELPADISLPDVEKTQTVDNPAFTLSQTQTRHGRIARTEYRFATLAPAVTPAQMTTYIKDIRRVQNEIHTNIFIGNDIIARNRPAAGLADAGPAAPRRNAAKAESATAYRAAAEQGFPQAQYNLALMYLEGRDVARDAQEAFAWMNKAALRGHAQAQYALGLMYERGDGTERDYRQALLWYLRSAEQDIVESQQRLGTLYERGLGTNPSREQAQLWYERAAAANNGRAFYNLGLLHADLGHRAAAYQWLILAERGGIQDARRARDELRTQMTPQQIAQAEDAARDWNPETLAPRKSPAKLLRGAQPPYPKQGRGAGKVVMSLSIDVDGRVLAALVSASSGSAALDQAALEAALHYSFSPARQNDKAVASQYSLTMKFRDPGALTL